MYQTEPVRVEVEALHRRVVRQVGVPAEDVRGIEPVDARGRRFVGTFGFAGTGRFAAVSVAAAGGAEREAQNRNKREFQQFHSMSF